MKLVLSRKGFDSSYGKMASPILPDGTLLPLPIPSNHDQARFSDADLADTSSLESLLNDLSKGRYRSDSTVHLDPDLQRPSEGRTRDWRPALGQSGAAQSHLSKMGVGKGDVFLFFGWFREVIQERGRWKYKNGAPDIHVLFGWLEIDEVLPVVRERDCCLNRYPWIETHPHVANPSHYSDVRNTLYIAAPSSRLLGPSRAGGGRFTKYTDSLCLTKSGSSRSYWSLPDWFYPELSQKPLTYHQDMNRWSREGNFSFLQTVGKGQEFVLDCQYYPKAEAWIHSVIQTGTM